MIFLDFFHPQIFFHLLSIDSFKEILIVLPTYNSIQLKQKSVKSIIFSLNNHSCGENLKAHYYQLITHLFSKCHAKVIEIKS